MIVQAAGRTARFEDYLSLSADCIVDLERTSAMLQTIAIILIVLWLLGLVTSYTMGGFIHVLLVLAVVVVLLRLIQGRRVV